jgi:hypothetical protein
MATRQLQVVIGHGSLLIGVVEQASDAAGGVEAAP